VGDGVGGRADAVQFGLECGELLGPAIVMGRIDVGQPAGGTVKPGHVVAGTGLLTGTPRPEAGRQVVEFAHGLPSSRGSADDPSNGNVCATLPVASPYRLTCRARTQLPAQMVTNSLHGRNINFLTGTASWWERLPTFSPV